MRIKIGTPVQVYQSDAAPRIADKVNVNLQTVWQLLGAIITAAEEDRVTLQKEIDALTKRIKILENA